ncbi:MAG: hypothetical protein KTR17_09795 [Cellvibrionaceae bacterium]|nr:hypothetical protein [Cellvibrionaceae bacterium]
MASQKLTWNGFGLRFFFALLLVYASYNPSGYSYVQWVLRSINPPDDSPLNITPYLAISGMVLVIGWVIYLRATFRSLGVIGLVLASVLFGCFVWLFIDLGWLSLTNVSAMAWITLALLALILALGMSWSHVRRRLSGQVDADDVDEK